MISRKRRKIIIALTKNSTISPRIRQGENLTRMMPSLGMAPLEEIAKRPDSIRTN